MSTIGKNFDERAALAKHTLVSLEGKLPKKGIPPKEGHLSLEKLRESVVLDLKSAVKELEQLRNPAKDRRGVEISLEEYAKDKWGFNSLSSMYDCLGVNPGIHTVDSFISGSDFNENYRWLVPEVIREAIRLGMRKSPIWPSLIASEETVSQPTVTMPAINMSDAMAKKNGEAETIETGTVSFGQKQITLQKVAMGLKITDEVNNFVPLNVLAIFLQDMGIKINRAQDNMAITTLINGDQADASENAPTIGVESTTNGFTYFDLLRVWIRMARIGRTPKVLLSNESPALTVLNLPEFKGFDGIATVKTKINLLTPIPTVNDYAIHGSMPATNQIMILDPTSALIKFNSQALKLESDRIVEKGLSATYATLWTGFGGLFRDARVLLDKSIAFSTNGFPTWMDPGAAESETFRS